MHPYSNKEPHIKTLQDIIQVDTEVRDLVFGDWDITLMKILTETRTKVTSKVMRPGMTSGGITKLTYKKAHTVRLKSFHVT